MRHLTQKLAFITILTFTGTVLFGQGFTPSVLDTGNSVIRGITLKVDDAGWLYIKPEARLEPGDLFDAYKGATGLGAYDTMVVEKQWTDQHDWSHIRYQQHYKGLEVEAAEWSEHWKDCFVEISHGKLVEGLDINVSPTLSEASALDLALQHIDASEYAWENEDWEDGLKEDVEDENATYYPEGELLIGHVFGDELIEENYRLAWKFQIRAIDPPSLDEIYIDAHTGDVLRMNPVGEGNGPANIMFGYGTQTIDTKPHLWYHILKADNNGRNIHTKFGTNLTDNFGWRPNITDPNDDWGNDDQRGTTAHWVVSEAWDYFRDVHNRNGFDGDGERVRVWANSNFVGVRFIRDGFRTFIELGSIDGNYAATLDFAGHEFTHGITHRVAGLGNTRESGALNESFSDIFGVLVERNTLDGNFNWLIGDDAIAGGIRSLSDPGTFGDPDIYMGPTWRDADPDNCPVPNQANDNCWVHFNCGVQNRWFHLIATGDTHNDITVQSLGIDNSADITYYSLFTFMQTASQYADARQGAINAARILYGRCSFEEIQTTNAWAACGVGDPFAGPCLHLSGAPSLRQPI
jgi:bacillolysin